MTEEMLRQKVRRHNTLNLVLVIVFVPGAMVLWYFSFHLFRWIYFFPMFLLGDFFLPGWDPWPLSGYIAWGSMAVLVLDGLRSSRQLFDLKEYSQSVFGTSIFSTTRQGRLVNAYFFHNAVGCAYVVSQVFYMAPEATLQALKALKSRLPHDPDTLRAAVRILGELDARRQWVPRARFREDARAVVVLERLRLIWSQEKDGLAQLRIPPGKAAG